jgi:ISXO2-like transposase domain
VIENVRADTLTEFVREAVSHKVSLLCTDQWVGYKHLGNEFPHASVDHNKGQYVRRVAYYEKDAVVTGVVHTNTIEGFWSIFKRGIVGSFHKVSKKYMPLYVAEFQFRYNNRENPDIFGTAIKGC